MARDKAMFSKSVTDRDAFVFDLSHDAQAFYFHLQGEADADGFIESARGAARRYGFDDGDFGELLEAGFIVEHDGGYLIRHWWVHNTYAEKRYHPGPHADSIRERYFDIAEEKGKGNRLSRAYEERGAPTASGTERGGSAANRTEPNQIELNSIELKPNTAQVQHNDGTGTAQGISNGREGKPGRGTAFHAQCPKCGADCFASDDPVGNVLFDCPECGTLSVDANGEISSG